MQRTSSLVALLAALTLGACSGEPATPATDAPSTSSSAPAAAGPLEPAPGGQVHVVEMWTDAEGNYFKPATLDVKRGDVIRFTLGGGVHNVHFPADSNPGQPMPKAGDMLQLPGQTTDVKVDWAAGEYHFLCDPHALLGMVGHVTVTE